MSVTIISLLLYIHFKNISELVFSPHEACRAQSEVYVVLLWVVLHIASVTCTHVVNPLNTN